MKYTPPMNIRQCIECLENKPLSEFFSNGFYKGRKKYKPRCRGCEHIIKRDRLKSIISQFYGGLRCSSCGYDKCYQALDCHHRDPTEKKQQIGKMGSFSKTNIISELEKCDLVCANCHREIHTTGDALG